MRLRFEFASRSGVLRAVFEGTVNDSELRHAYQEVKRYVQATDALVGIWDMSGITSFDVATETVRDLGRQQPAMAPVVNPRFIVAPTEHIFGLARMFQEIGDTTRPRLKVVRSLEEVYEQLGIDNPNYESISL